MFRKPLLKEPVRSLAGRRVQWNIAKLLGRRIESSNSTLHGRLWLRKRRLKNAKLWFRNLCHNHAKIWFLKGRRTAEAKTKSKAPSQSSCLGRYINQRWTDILIFEGIMVYFSTPTRSWGAARTLPQSRFPWRCSHRFQQDNDPKHKSKTLQYYNKNLCYTCKNIVAILLSCFHSSFIHFVYMLLPYPSRLLRYGIHHVRKY